MVRQNIESKAQAHALEAFMVAAVILIAVTLVYTTLSTPQSSVSEGGIPNNVENPVQESLIVLHETGELHESVLDWNSSDGFSGGSNSYYTSPTQDDPLLNMMEDRLFDKGYIYNINVSCGSQTERYLYLGSNPGYEVSEVSYVIELNDFDRLSNGGMLENENYICDDVDTSNRFYNTLEIKVIAWRT